MVNIYEAKHDRLHTFAQTENESLIVLKEQLVAHQKLEEAAVIIYKTVADCSAIAFIKSIQ